MKVQILQWVVLTLLCWSCNSDGGPALQFDWNSINEDSNVWGNTGSDTLISHVSLDGYPIAEKGALRDKIKSVCFEADTCLRVEYDINPITLPSLSIELYAYQLSMPNHGAWVMSQDPGHYGRSIMMHDDRFTPSGFSQGLAQGVDHSYVGHSPLANNQWSHIIAVWSDEGNGNCNAKLYVNDDEPITTSCNGQKETNSFFCMNRNSNHGGLNWNGCFSKVAVYDYALSDNEIKGLKSQYKGAVYMDYDAILDELITTGDDFVTPIVEKTRKMLKNLLDQEEGEDIASDIINHLGQLATGSHSNAASKMQPVVAIGGPIMAMGAYAFGGPAGGAVMAGTAAFSSVLSLTASKGPSMGELMQQVIDAIGELIDSAFVQDTLTEIQVLLTNVRDDYRDFQDDLEILTKIQYETDNDTYCVWTNAFDGGIRNILYESEEFQLNTATYLKQELYDAGATFAAETVEVLYDLCRVHTIRHAALLAIYSETTRQLNTCKDVYDATVLREIESRQQKAWLDFTNDEKDLAATLEALPVSDYSTDGLTSCGVNPETAGCDTNPVVQTLYECIAAREDKCLLIDSWMRQLDVVLPWYWTKCQQPLCFEGSIQIERVPCAGTAYVKCAQCVDYETYWTQCREGTGGCDAERTGGVEVPKSFQDGAPVESNGVVGDCGEAGGNPLSRFKCQICSDIDDDAASGYIDVDHDGWYKWNVTVIGVVLMLLVVNVVMVIKIHCDKMRETSDCVHKSI